MEIIGILFGWVRGGLVLVVVFVGVFLVVIIGVVVVMVVVMGLIFLFIMLCYGYNKELVIGVIVVLGILG